MDMSKVIKTFIRSVHDFEKENNIDSLIHNLQILSASNDLAVFDARSFEAVEFYILLHDLLNNHLTDNEVVWHIVNVLKVAMRNPKASTALIHTYHFIQPLTTILDSQLTSDRKLMVLRLIQELSYGLVIRWQEAYLPKLIGVLIDMITSSEERELIATAIGVLVNLCHKNKPAVYTLMNCVDIKVFLRTILNLQRENVDTSVQVCKLLMVLNQLSGNVPDAEILSFVRMSFSKINKAFNSGNTFLLRHIVDFFREAKESEHGRKVLVTYPTYQQETDNLISSLNSKTVPDDWQCAEQLMEFFLQLVSLKLVAIVPLFTRLAHSIFPWVQVAGVAPIALQLLSTMLYQSRQKDEVMYKSLCSSIESHLQVLVEMLHNWCKAESVSSEVRDTLSQLLHLFRELAANPSLSTTLASVIDKEELKKLLLPLMSLNVQDGSQLFQQPVITVYVEVLSFMSELSLDDTEWLFLYSDMLQKKPILKALAVALYSGPYEVKKQILYLAGTTSFSKDCLTTLARCLSDMNQLFLFDFKVNNQNADKNMPISQSQLEFSQSFTKTQREGLDSLIEKLDDLFKKNQINDSSVSGIIEMYNYKLSEMRRGEQWYQSSLVAADSHRNQLSHRVAQLSAETSRLHQLLYSSQQTLESSQTELKELKQQLDHAQHSASSSHIKFKQLKQDVQSKSIIIKDQSEEILTMKQTIETQGRKCDDLELQNSSLMKKIEEQSRLIEEKTLDMEERIEQLNKSVQKLETEKSDLLATTVKLEEKLAKRDKLIVEKEALVDSLEQEIGSQQGRIKTLEKTAKVTEKELSSLKNQLVDLERQRKLIFEITSGKKK